MLLKCVIIDYFFKPNKYLQMRKNCFIYDECSEFFLLQKCLYKTSWCLAGGKGKKEKKFLKNFIFHQN